MSLIKTKSIQLGWDLTPTNNFTIYQPATPDGTFRIATGNSGSETDVMTVSSDGSVTYAGTTSYAGLGFGTGSATAPSLYPNGDTNTGIYFPTAETIGFSTNGTERVRIDSTGNLLVGSASGYRSGKLVVKDVNKSQTSTTANLHVSTTDAPAINVGGSIGLGGQVGGDETPFGYISGRKENNTSGNYAGYLALATQDSSATVTERMRINSAGSVGIGTTAPDSILDVKAGTYSQFKVAPGVYTSARIGRRPANDAYASLEFDAGGASFPKIEGANTDLSLWTSNTERMRIDGNGRVTMPTQPSFMVRRSSVTGSPTDPIVWDQVASNVGNYYNSSTGRFTAPVSGRYLFTLYAMSYSTNFTTYMQLGGTVHYLNVTTGSTTGSESVIVNLGAGDSCYVRMAGGSINSSNGDNNCWAGMLIG